MEQANNVKVEEVEQGISRPKGIRRFSRKTFMTIIIVVCVGLVAIALIVGIKVGVVDKKTPEPRYDLSII